MYKAPGTWTDNWAENLRINPTSFATPSDDYFTTALLEGTPARTTHTHDATAFPTQPNVDNWQARLIGQQSPARVSAQAGDTGTGTYP